PGAHTALRLLEGDPWLAVRALVNLLESAPEETHTRRAAALLAGDGPLARAARRVAPSEELETLLVRRSLTWKTTERNLEPIVEFARAVGRAELAARLGEARRDQRAPRPAAAADRDAIGRNFMTR